MYFIRVYRKQLNSASDLHWNTTSITFRCCTCCSFIHWRQGTKNIAFSRSSALLRATSSFLAWGSSWEGVKKITRN